MPTLSFILLNVPFSVPLMHWDHPLPAKRQMDQDWGSWRMSSSFSSQPFLPVSFQSCCISPILRGRNFHTIKRGWLLNLFCPSGPLGTLKIEKWVVVSLNHGHLYLLLGRRLRVGGDDHVYQGWLQALVSGLREDSGTRRNICGNFFYFLWVPNCDRFW